MENTVNHTPGPWTYECGDDGAVVYKEAVGTVANVPDDLTASEANARLIAAAPDLLAALVDARNVLALALPKFGEDSTDDEDSADDVQGLINRIDDAIAKAKGEA